MEDNKEKRFKISHEKWTSGVVALLVLCLAILFFFAVYRWNGLAGGYKTIRRILQPFVMGAIMAWLVVPLYNACERVFTRWISKGEKTGKVRSGLVKTLTTVVCILVIIGILYAMVAMIVPQMLQSISSIVANSKMYMDTITEWADTFADKNADLAQTITLAFSKMFGSFGALVNDTILPWLTGIVGGLSSQIIGFFKFLINFLIGIVVCIYVLNSKRTLLAQSKRIVYSIFRVDRGNTIIESTRFANRVFYGFISGKLWDSLIIGILCFICINIMHIPYSLLISVIVGVTNIIPCFGPFIGAVPCGLLLLIEDPLKCLYFVIFIVILQQIDGNIIGPKILGESVGISPLWILFSIVVFGGIWGFAGMVLGVPVFTCIYTFCRWLIQRSLAKKKLPTATGDYEGVGTIDPDTLNIIPITPEQMKRSSGLFRKKKKAENEANTNHENK